jgi:membrane protein
MPEPAATHNNLARRAIGFVWVATQCFLEDDVPRLAAAMSYFALLALAPLVLLANIVLQFLGLVTGQSAGGLPTLSTAGAAAATGFKDASAWAGSYAPWVIVVLVIVGVVSVFAEFVQAIDRIWKTPKRGSAARTFLRHRGLAFALLGVATGAFVLVIVLSAIVGVILAVGISYVQSQGVTVTGVFLNGWVRAALVYFAAVLLFVVAFAVVPDRPIRWLDVLPGALVTAAGFLIGELILQVYLATTQRFVMFGASQFFVGLTVWIYYSAIVVLWGVELTRLMVLDAETRRGKPAESLADTLAESLGAEQDAGPAADAAPAARGGASAAAEETPAS